MRPADAQFLNNMAFAEIHLNDGASAAFHLRQAHELDPNSPLIRTNLIVALNLSGDTAGADQVLAEIKSPDERDTVRAFVHRTIASNAVAGGVKS
jgi:Flp pilus assembly protein TadD